MALYYHLDPFVFCEGQAIRMKTQKRYYRVWENP